MNIDEPALIAAAREAARNAHAPYSRFAVGAAVLLTDGSVVTAANFENASYGLSLCAETVALAKVSSDGRLRDVAAIAGDRRRDGRGRRRHRHRTGQPVRALPPDHQRAAQMGGRDLPVICGAAEGDAVAHYRLSELLPAAFGPGDLGIR